MRKLSAFALFSFLLSTSATVEALKVPGFPEIPDSLITINTQISATTETLTAINLRSGNHNLLGVLHLPTSTMPKEGFPAVILFHGFRGSKFGIYKRISSALAAAGIAVIRFDMAGCGDSEGIPEEIPMHTYLQNGEDIVHAVAKYPEINAKRIGLAGFSLGCHTTLHLARFYSPSKFSLRAISLWAPVADGAILFKEIYKNINGSVDLANNFFGKDFGFGSAPLVLCSEDVSYFLSLQDHIVLNSLPIKVPILHLQGLNDTLVSLTHQSLFQNTAPGNVCFKSYERTGHSIDGSPHVDTIIHDIVKHFQSFL
ncbi:dienelactone hydrolase family protein [Chlamydia ibidis]|uniref:Dienelactone hydrolase family protein n=2 Tax=Chlamydia ibidis TaxID=1405396 RepID=S7J1P2_9CHLA|nr:alpha/beta hydrolase [Chlamydia ibidis]EPP34304.1 dienelactone hydrolase family protein [Chlamydia ibidis]EQM62567.1 dienelactone hydrolase family protein [Chlamydia ibidis 10-1398/6]